MSDGKFSLVILTSWFSRSIHRHFHALGVESKDGRRAGDEDGQVEALAPATATDEAKIVELGDVVLHDCSVVPQLATEVLIVASSQGDHSPVIDLTQRNHLGKDNRKRMTYDIDKTEPIISNLQGLIAVISILLSFP